MEISDGAIVGRVVAGDVDAYEVLVARYYERCLRYAWRMLGEEADAKDVVQEAFVRAYRSLASYRDDGRFDAWLFRIVFNRCRTAAARRRRGTLVPLESVSADLAQPSNAESVLWREELARALGDLAPRYREAFLLKYVDDLSYEQMSALTGDGVSALKMRVKRARAELKARLGNVYNA